MDLRPSAWQGREAARVTPASALAGRSESPILFQPDERAARRFWEFFTANIPKDHTRRAYFGAAGRFSAWCLRHGIIDLAAVQPIHVAAWIQELGRDRSRPTVKQHLAAIRMLFDWMVLGQIVAHIPAASVRGPKHSVKKGK